MKVEILTTTGNADGEIALESLAPHSSAERRSRIKMSLKVPRVQSVGVGEKTHLVCGSWESSAYGQNPIWGISSVGRALHLQGRSHRFKPYNPYEGLQVVRRYNLLERVGSYLKQKKTVFFALITELA